MALFDVLVLTLALTGTVLQAINTAFTLIRFAIDLYKDKK